jgi:hypothetical protein
MDDVLAYWEDSFGAPVNGLVSMTHRAWLRVLDELREMVPVVDSPSAPGILRRVRRQAAGLLHAAELDFMRCVIRPWVPLRISPHSAPLAPSPEALKVGVLPFSSDPLQWSHVLTGLAAAAELHLDHVVYFVTDDDSDRGGLHLPAELRSRLAQSILSSFSPLLLFSSLGSGYGEKGIDALFHFLHLNERQPMQITYIPAGANWHPEGQACRDATEEIEEAIRAKPWGYDEQSHPISLALSRRDSAWMSCVMTFRHVFVDFPLPEASSEELLSAIVEDHSLEALALVPGTVYQGARRYFAREALRPRLPVVAQPSSVHLDVPA